MSNLPSQYQKDLLEKEDWRYFAIGPYGTGLVSIATVEKVSKLSKKALAFGLPSAPALYLNLAKNAQDRRKSLDVLASFTERHEVYAGDYPKDQKILFDFFQEFAAEVIFSFTAIESFANEMIPLEFRYDWMTSKATKLNLNASEIERQVSLDEKLKSVLPLAHSLKSPAGTKVWENYRKIKNMRDRLIHLKYLDRKSSGPEFQTIWGLMLAERDADFALSAYLVIGAYPSLVKESRWFKQAGELLNVKQKIKRLK